jgi:hypothetical protein
MEYLNIFEKQSCRHFRDIYTTLKVSTGFVHKLNMNTHIEITLNSLVRRTKHTDQLKALLKKNGGKLTRKGRSRNWKLELSYQDKKTVVNELYNSDEPSLLWIAKLLAQQEKTHSHEQLVTIARQAPAITVNQLVAETNCSLAEARKALDELEWL